MYTNNKSKYFAALPTKETVAELMHRTDMFSKNMLSNSYLDKLKKSWSYYYGSFGKKGGEHGVSFVGEQQELVQFPVNQYRNIAQHIKNMTTSNRPAVKSRATNTDVKSLAQTILSDGLLEYYFREKKLEDYVDRASEYAIVFGEGFIRLGWNATDGQVFEEDEETGEKFYEGDLEFGNLSPFDIIRDCSKEDNNHDWYLVRSFKNRHALIAKYPELESELLAVQSKDDLDSIKWPVYGESQTDDIPIYEFFHKRNDALPDGRYVVYASQDAVLYDGPLPYRDIPIYRISYSDLLGTPFGYTILFDLMPIQEMINMLYSIIATNQNAFGVQNVLIPKGADINFIQLSGGMNLIEYNNISNAKPEALNLTQTPQEIFKMIEVLEQQMETLSGINSVTRGQPEASLRSAASLALIQAQAVQFSSPLQHSYTRLVEDVATGCIRILQDYAKYPRVAAIAGKSQKVYMKYFSSKDLIDISRVTVETSNPLAKTTAGRVEIAQQLIQMQVIKTPEQYITVLNTGKLDTLYEGDQAEYLLIRSENEDMMDGKEVSVIDVDAHQIHIQEHKALLADPELRKDPGLVTLVLNHIQEHLTALRSTDPGLLMITKQQPLPPLPGNAPQSPPGAEQAPQDAGQGIPGIEQAQTGFQEAQNTAQPNIPNPPPPFENLPTNPANTTPEGV